MQTYLGTKAVTATPMNRADYNAYRGWVLPINENGSDEGYLVEYTDGGKPNDARHTGYISWSPKEQFDNAYRSVTGMSFGLAIEAMRKGLRVARAGWNGKGMWIALSGLDGVREVAAGSLWSPANAAFAQSQPGHVAKVQPCFTMKTAADEIQMGWLASQSDMLATDWTIV